MTCWIRDSAAEPSLSSVQVPARIVNRLLLFPLGVALLFSGLISQGGTALTPSGAGAAAAVVTPTPDRLAEPTLPASPHQADAGAQVYWLSCMPCHGDKGQGLTAEFRQTYPPDHQDCWKSGCHGPKPYANGFTVPAAVPALIGPKTLQKFPTASSLRAYIAAAMPFSTPGSLSEDKTWEVTAFLLRENQLWKGDSDLGPANADQVPIGPPNANPPDVPSSSGSSAPARSGVYAGLPSALVVLGILLLILATVVVVARRGGRGSKG